MFTKKITESDAFLDLPLSTQTLYFHLCMNADDEGFVNNPKKIARMVGSNDDDMRLLIAKAFVLRFDDKGIIVIKHWWMHNYIRKDRFKPTEYLEEREFLYLKDNRAYTLDESQGTPLKSVGIPNDNQMDTQNRIDKNRLDKNRIDKNGDLKQAKELFEKLWKEYPRKKGKGAVSDTQKKKLLKIGYDELSRAICRYRDYVSGKDEQYIMYGSRFFNTGYQDYLDKNYDMPKTPKQNDNSNQDSEWQVV